MVSYNRETGRYEHTVYSTVISREKEILVDRLKEAGMRVLVQSADVLLPTGRGTRYYIVVESEDLKELEEHIKKAEEIIQEFLKEEEEKEKLAMELNKKLAKANK